MHHILVKKLRSMFPLGFHLGKSISISLDLVATIIFLGTTSCLSCKVLTWFQSNAVLINC